MADLVVGAERLDGRTVLAITGELDLASVPVLEEAVTAQLAAATGDAPLDLVLDLSGLAFLDSSGLGALLRVRAQILEAGGRLSVSAVAPGPARVIAIAGLASTFGLREE